MSRMSGWLEGLEEAGMICLFSDPWCSLSPSWTLGLWVSFPDAHRCQHIQLSWLGVSLLVWSSSGMPVCLGNQSLPGI